MTTKPKDHTKTIDTLKRTVGELKKNVSKVTKGHEKMIADQEKAAAEKEQEPTPEDHQAALDHFASQYKMAKINKEEDKAKEYAASYHKYAAKLDKHYHSKLKEDTMNPYKNNIVENDYTGARSEKLSKHSINLYTQSQKEANPEKKKELASRSTRAHSIAMRAKAAHQKRHPGKVAAYVSAAMKPPSGWTNESADACHVCGQTPCNCTHMYESAYKPSTAERLNQQLKKGGFDADASLARIKAIEAKYKKPEPPKEENKSVKEELKGGPEYTIARSKHWKQGHASAKRGDIYQNPYGKASARTYEQGQYRQGYKAGKADIEKENNKKQGVAEDAQQVNELSTEKLMSYLKAVHNDSMKHKADPTKRSAAKRNKSVAGFARAFNKVDARKD